MEKTKEIEIPSKSKEEILAERKAKKAEKAAKKSQPSKTPSVTTNEEPAQTSNPSVFFF